MGLEGSLRDFGIADILQIIYYQKKTGSLIIDGRFDRVKILFKGGNIVAVESRRRLESNRLGRVLVKKGLLSIEELDTILKEQKISGLRLGEILIQKGIDAQVISDTLVKQFTETLVQILGWKEGYYEFRTEGVSISKELPISIDTQHMLMDGLRMLDEYSIIGEKITPDIVFERIQGEEFTSVELKEEEKTILELINGENDLGTVIELSGLEEVEVSKIILKLLKNGLIKEKKAEEFVVKELPSRKRKIRISSDHLYYLMFAVVFFVSLLWLKGFNTDINRFLAFKDIEKLYLETEFNKIKNGYYPPTIEDILNNLNGLKRGDLNFSGYNYRLHSLEDFTVPIITNKESENSPYKIKNVQ